jgi:hypothetical protein
MEIEHAAKKVKNFEGNSLADTLCDIEIGFRGANNVDSEQLCKKFQLDSCLISSALELKRAAAQINVIIHALGILLSLPRILNKDERIEYLSLGAGNTGRKFDLETNIRIAEFKFINWQGGAEAIRQNSIFKDFYELAEYGTDKKRYLYVLGTQIPLKFFNGSRAIKSVLSRNNKLDQEFSAKYRDRFNVVSEYYLYKKDSVMIEDIANIVPELKSQQ